MFLKEAPGATMWHDIRSLCIDAIFRNIPTTMIYELIAPLLFYQELHLTDLWIGLNHLGGLQDRWRWVNNNIECSFYLNSLKIQSLLLWGWIVNSWVIRMSFESNKALTYMLIWVSCWVLSHYNKWYFQMIRAVFIMETPCQPRS